MPTQGFNIKSLMHDGFKLNVWDIGGLDMTFQTTIAINMGVNYQDRNLSALTGEIILIRLMLWYA